MHTVCHSGTAAAEELKTGFFQPPHAWSWAEQAAAAGALLLENRAADARLAGIGTVYDRRLH